MNSILITGCNRGIGLALTQQYLQAGWQVHATARDLSSADALHALEQQHAHLALHSLDVSEPDHISELAHQLDGQAIDVFLNNAGVYGPGRVQFGDVDAETWMEVFQVNTIAPLLLAQALLPNLRAGQSKKMVFVSSKVGSISDNSSGAGYYYRSSKTALNQVVKSLSVDLASEGFVVAALHPGWVLTDMGGPNALIDVDTSATGLRRVIDNLSPSTSGHFINYDGSEIPW